MKRHIFLKSSLSIISILIAVCAVMAQDSLTTVKAENGDGIYSILRKQGIDPVKYYEDFLSLNKNNIKDASKLYEGRAYFIPYAPDSFRARGLRLQMPKGTETPIFNEEVTNFIRKDTVLGNTVYYLISTRVTEGKASDSDVKISLENDIVLGLAKELLQHGALVYVLQNFQSVPENGFNISNESLEIGNREASMDKKEALSSYIDIINKRYLKHSAKYQRLLVVRTNGNVKGSKINMTIYHHEGSKKGAKLANNIQQMFQENGVRQKSYKKYIEVFSDKNNLYFARNTVPIMTYIEIGERDKKEGKTFKTTANKKNITNLITKGILRDYSKLSFDDE